MSVSASSKASACLFLKLNGNTLPMKTFNKITILFTLLICLLLSYSLLYQVYLEQTCPIYDNTLRFHVRADSDKKEAQERKLIVRDAVLRYVKEDVYRADSAQELEQNLAAKTEEIAQVAANASDGQPVRVYFTKERFPIRHYGTAIFPAGEYQALRVDIGKAAGHNWWCAFYPNLCYTPEKNFTLSENGKKQWKKITSEGCSDFMAFVRRIFEHKTSDSFLRSFCPIGRELKNRTG